jgi:hypothetical protein
LGVRATEESGYVATDFEARKLGDDAGLHSEDVSLGEDAARF